MKIKQHSIVFLGQTGYGKSSLINALFGTHFNTDPLISCKKELYSVTTIIGTGDNSKLITVYDTPGIGEFSNNTQYQLFYNLAVGVADHIVLVLTLDRTDSTSQDLLIDLRQFIKNKRVKFTIALNRIDSSGVKDDVHYKAWDDEKNEPSIECERKIEKRKKTIIDNYRKSSEFEFLPFKIVPVCAIRNYGINELKERILK